MKQCSTHGNQCPYFHNDNRLKGASAINNNNKNNSPKLLTFNKSEIALISKCIELIRYYITKNKNQFQSPNDWWVHPVKEYCFWKGGVPPNKAEPALLRLKQRSFFLHHHL